ncbi:MAG: hypothetical protein RLO80_13160 [Hyphomonas sp.]
MLNDTKRGKILGALSALALTGLYGQAAHAQFAVKKCTEITAPSGSDAQIAQICGSVTDPVVAEDMDGAERGYAFFHAANAQARLNNPVAAADLVTRSYSNLTDASPSLALAPIKERPRSKKKAKVWDDKNAEKSAFKFNRTMLKARSLQTLASRFASGQIGTSDTTQCSDEASCIDSAINFLAGQEAVLTPFKVPASAKEGPQVDAFNFLKAELIEARNRGSDRANALAAYKVVMDGNSGSPEESKARAKIEVLGIELGNAARVSTSGPVSEQALSDAVGFYEKALAANPASLPALLGKGSANLERASLSNVSDASRRAYYGEAVTTFDTASRSVPAGGVGYGAASYELGNAKTAWANYLENLPPRTETDRVKLAALRKEAVTNYEAAVAASPAEAPYLRGLATAYNANGEKPKAVVAYRKAIAALLGSSAGAAWDVPSNETDRKAFATRVSSLPKPDQKFISSALLDLGATTGETADILLAAKLADSTSVKPALKLAELYAKSNASAARQEIAYVLAKSEQSPGIVRDGMEEDRAAAYFLRSELGARPTPTAEAINDADNALKIQPSNPGYANWACVVRILAGGDYVRGTNISSGCVGLIGDEREVLRGMFLLRVAALAPASQKQAYRNQAQTVFGQGNTRLGANADYRAKTGDFPWWTQGKEATKLRALLLYGEAAAITCAGAPWNPDFTPAERDLAASFFIWHNANAC